MSPLRFGDEGRQLFGMLDVPAGTRPTVGVVICPPFGQEAMRAHRILRVLGERLVKSGLAVLRYDAFATGDSDGDDAEASLAAWIDDVAHADTALRRNADVSRTRWLGVRLGASLAMLAAGRPGNRPERLLAWEPIVDGPAYLAELAAAHERALGAGAMGFVETLRHEARPRRDPGELREVLGFPLTPGLAGPLEALGPGSFGALDGLPVDVLVGPARRADPALGEAMAQARANASTTPLDADVAWLIDGGDDFPSVPATAVQAIAARAARES